MGCAPYAVFDCKEMLQTGKSRPASPFFIGYFDVTFDCDDCDVDDCDDVMTRCRGCWLWSDEIMPTTLVIGLTTVGITFIPNLPKKDNWIFFKYWHR